MIAIHFDDQCIPDRRQRVLARDYLKNLSPTEFAREAADILGDVNYVHPFREGNGRTQLQYLKERGYMPLRLIGICGNFLRRGLDKDTFNWASESPAFEMRQSGWCWPIVAKGVKTSIPAPFRTLVLALLG